MSTFKLSILSYLIELGNEIFTASINEEGEISILIKRTDEFKFISETIHDSLILNRPDFEQSSERIVVLISNGTLNSEIIINHNSEDLNDDYLTIR